MGNDLDLMNVIKSFLDDYYEKVDKSNASSIIKTFKSEYDEWKNIVEYMRGDELYGKALVIFSVAISFNPNQDNVKILSNAITDYDSKDECKYKFEIKYTLYLNLGLCWHKLGKIYDDKAIESFKMYLLYEFAVSNHTSYSPTCYAFRPCSKYLYQSLINEQLNLSSPITFNDIFDCPLLYLLQEDDVSKLIRTAYLKGLKVACFMSNIKQPYLSDPNDMSSQPILDEKKHYKDKKEFLNGLMWAHYADSHKGVCIKYKFSNDITKFVTENKDKYVSYFSDVVYSSDLQKYSSKSTISVKDAFFAKGKCWEYENELRLLYYNPNDEGNYVTIPFLNCIEAVYFGVRCSEKDRDSIINILKDKKLKTSKQQYVNGKLNDLIVEKRINFYQMEKDNKKFGFIKAKKIKI